MLKINTVQTLTTCPEITTPDFVVVIFLWETKWINLSAKKRPKLGDDKIASMPRPENIMFDMDLQLEYSPKTVKLIDFDTCPGTEPTTVTEAGGRV